MLHFVLVESKKSFISQSVRCITNCTIILFRSARETELGVLSADSGVEEIMTCFKKKNTKLSALPL